MVPPPPPPPPHQQQHRTSSSFAAINRAIDKRKNQHKTAKQRLDEFEREKQLEPERQRALEAKLRAKQDRGKAAAAVLLSQAIQRQRDRSLPHLLPPIRTAGEVAAASAASASASAARSVSQSERNAGPHKTARKSYAEGQQQQQQQQHQEKKKKTMEMEKKRSISQFEDDNDKVIVASNVRFPSSSLENSKNQHEQQQNKNKKQKTISSTFDDDDDDTESESEDGNGQGKYIPPVAPARAAAARTVSLLDKQSIQSTGGGVDQSPRGNNDIWHARAEQIIAYIQDLINNKKIKNPRFKDFAEKDYRWLMKYHWNFSKGRRSSNHEKVDRREKLQIISALMNWPATPPPETDNPDDVQQKQQRKSPAPSAADSKSPTRDHKHVAASSQDNETVVAGGQVVHRNPGDHVQEDTNEDDSSVIAFDLSRDSMREELCKMTGKKYAPHEGREAIRTLYKCMTTENGEINDEALSGFQNLFLGLGGVDSVLTFMRSRYQEDNIVTLKLAAAILVFCCSDAKADDESKSPSTSSSTSGNSVSTILCKQIVQFDGIDTLLRIMRRLRERSTELDVLSLFDQIWHALSNICAVDECLVMMEKELHIHIIEYAMDCMQAIVKTSDNRGDNPVENSTNVGCKRMVLQMGKSCLLTIDNLCDNENKDSSAQSKIDDGAYHHLNILKRVMETICAAMELSMESGQEWDDDSLALISNALTLIATFDQNGWLEKDNFHMISPFLDGLLRSLSSEAYEDFGEELFEMITAMSERLGKSAMQESIVTAALQNLVVARDFEPPEKAKRKAKALLKDIWR